LLSVTRSRVDRWFTTGPDDGMVHGLGASGERLHDWLGTSDESASRDRSVL